MTSKTTSVRAAHVSKRPFRLCVSALLLLLVLCSRATSLFAQSSLSPQDTVDLLRSLATEGRVGLQNPNSPTDPRLFTARVQDGRTIMEFIADTLGAAAGGDPAQPNQPNHWALLDEAVSITLAEADRMKALAGAAAGTQSEARFLNARKMYLQGAARLLKYYKVSSADVFDSTAGPFVGLPDLPDWLLPGEIQIREVSGAGRFNTRTRDFAGRLSGTLAIPGLGATLTMPNASFDTDGRFDISAYGGLTFPGGRLDVPPRKPWHIRSTPERGLAMSGDVRLTLDNGLRFDGSVALADPMYCFGLAARGLEFDLGKSLLLRLPTLSLEQINTFGDETRDAFADYFRHLNGSLETVLTAVTNFPPISETQFGQPPEFIQPEIPFDFSPLNAWSAEIIANTRAGLVLAQQDLQPVLDSVYHLNQQARIANNALTDELKRMANLAARLELRRQMQKAADEAARQQAVTDNGDVLELKAQLVAGARKEGELIVALVTPDLLDRLGESLEVVKLLLNVQATLTELGEVPAPQGTLPSDPCAACIDPAANYVQRAETLALCAGRRQALRYGLDPNTGTIVNPGIFNTLTPYELYRTARLLADIEAELTEAGLDVLGSYVQFMGPLLERQRQLMLQELSATGSLPRSFELLSLIMDNVRDSIDIGLDVNNQEVVDTLDSIMGPRLRNVTPAVVDKAMTEAQMNLSQRRIHLRSDVDAVLGRLRDVGVIRPGDSYQPDPLTQLDQFFRITGLAVPPAMGSSIDDYVRFKVAELRARPFTVEFLTNRLGDANNLLSTFIGLTDWADTRLDNDFAFLEGLRLSLTNFTISLVGAAELQNAWWLIDRYQDAFRVHAAIYGQTLNEALRTAERQSRDAALLASSRISSAFSNFVNELVTYTDVIVPLPGNVQIDSIFGRLCYNRGDGTLSGCFGGRLEFPEVGPDVFFEISEACLSTDGSYQIAAATAAPLPFGRLQLTSSMDVSGTSAGVASFNGEGTLQIDTGSGFPAGPSFGVSVGYNSQTRKLALGSSVTQLRLSDQMALLDGSVGASVSLAQPQGALEISGKLGLLAREPLPEDRALAGNDFWLTIDALPTVFTYTDHDFTAEFTGGSISLPPDLFRTDDANNRVPVTVAITGRLCIRYDFAQNRLEFCGEPGAPFTVALQNLVLELPELPGFALTIQAAELELSGTQFPLLKQLAGTLALPLPGADASDPSQNRSGLLNLSAQNWRIDGLPEAASIAIGSDLRLADFNGFTFDVLTGSALSFASELADGVRHTTFSLNGNLRAGFDERALTDDASGNAVRFTVEGLFAWDMQSLPIFELDSLLFEGQFRLGEDGPLITGLNQGQLARLQFLDLQNFFNQAPNRPFTIAVEGALEIPGTIKFGLINTKFIIDGAGLRFFPGGVQAELGNQVVDVVRDALPLYLSKAGLTFKNPALPLIPGANETGLFDLANIVVTISGGVNVPNQAAMNAGAPGFAGEVNDLAMSLRRDAQNNLIPEFSLNGFGVELNNVDIPPLGALTGGLYVGNLNDAPNLYFAGMVSGKVNDIGAGITMAVHRQKGLLGSCFELDVGPAGIPIDGGTLGGILLTGGKGGLSFGNQFADPCDFRTNIQFATVNGQRQPVNDGTTDTFDSTGSPPPVQIPPVPPSTQPGPDSCIIGTFPPPTINPLCELHPTIPNRIIFKGTARTEADLVAIGLTRNALPSSLNAAVAFAVGKMTDPLRDIRTALVGAVPPGVPTETKNFYTDLLDKQIRQMENTATAVIANALGAALQTNPNTNLYDAVVSAAEAGIPCLDATLKLQGNFSHAAVSTVLKGEGAVIVSTTGSALLQGTIKLIGIPIGEGTLAFSLTDSQGNINPSFGGVVIAGVGPLSLGEMSLAYQCEGCFDAVIDAFGAFVQANAQNLNSDIKGLMVQIMNRSVPVDPPRPLSGDPAALFLQLSPRQKLGYVVSLFNVVDVVAKGESLAGVAPATVAGFVGTFREFVTDVATQVDPRFCFQAKVKPTLFGFPLVPGPTPLDARFAYERVFDTNLNQSFQRLSANAVFSPAFLIATMTTPGAGLMPATDQANLGFSFQIPAFTADNVAFAMTNPVQFAANQFTSFVQDSVFTFGYSFMPLGVPLADGQARVIMPRLTNHPTNPNRVGGAWSVPSGQGIATRDEVILAALIRGLLQNPNWRGDRGLLDDLFAPFPQPPVPNTPESYLAGVIARIDSDAMAQLGFAEDYFPHGGVIGASQLQLPKVMAEAPPLDLIGRVFDVSNPNWITDAQTLFDTYLTANTVVGQMAAYIPAPNPPPGFNFTTNTLEELIDAIGRADVLAIMQRTAPGGLYPFEQLLLSGWLKAQILGMPLAEGSIRFDEGNLKVHAAVPSGTWLHDFIGAEANLEIRQPAFMSSVGGGNSIEEMYAATPSGSVQDRFAARRALIGPGMPADFVSDTVNMIYQTLPKASMEVAAQMQVPPELQSLLKQKAGTALTFFAFSPAFDPFFGLNGSGALDDDISPYAVAKRRGGLGVRGEFDFGLNLADADPNNDIRISVPDASFSITPDANVGVFPALSAQLKVADVNLPGLPRLTDGVINFSTSPDNLASYVALGAKVEPFEIMIPVPLGQPVPMVQFLPRTLGGIVGGNLSIFRDDGVPVTQKGARLHIDAMRVNMPMLGPNVAMTIYGQQNGSTFTPFLFSTTAGEPWAATVRIHAADNENAPPVFGICDPRSVTRDVNGNWVGNPDTCAMTFALAQPLNAAMEGRGLESFRLTLNFPQLSNVVFFPNGATRTEVPLLGSQSTPGVMMIEKSLTDGLPRFYVDFGQVNNLGLPGIVSASGRFEFGFNPTEVPGPLTRTPASLAFGSTEICGTNPPVRQVTITNTRAEPANVILRVTQPDHYTVLQNQFSLARNGGSRTVDVLFHPRTIGSKPATLFIESDNPDSPSLSVSLSGTGTATPRYFQSRNSIDFGDTVAGQVAVGTVVVANQGCGSMSISSVSISGPQAAAFTVSPAGAVNLASGQSRLYRIEFAPTSVPIGTNTSLPHSATLTIVTNSAGSHTVTLTGNATDSRWITLMDSQTAGSTAHFNDILMTDAKNGWVVGNAGSIYQTVDGGRSWRVRVLTPFNLNAIHAEATISDPLLAAYHFEEPTRSTRYRDDGPYGFHANAETNTAAPAIGYSNGRIGSGLSFDGVNDSAYIAGSLALSNSSTIALWANISATPGADVLVAQTDPGVNATIFSLETTASSYLVRFGSQSFSGGAISSGWQHLALIFSHDAADNVTLARLLRNGTTLWTTNFTGALPVRATRILGIGARYQSFSSRTSFFTGMIDELHIFGGALGPSAIALLANGEGGMRLLAVGDEGTVLQSETMGRTWHKAFDLNPDGWRQRDGEYWDYDWKGVTVTSGGKIVLGGTKRNTTGIAVNNSVIMIEDLYPGLPTVVGDERYDEITFDRAADIMINEVIANSSGKIYGITYGGRVFQSPSVLTDPWPPHGTLDLNLPLTDATFVSSTTYLAVGTNGTIIRSLSGANPVVITHGLTSNHLHGIDYVGTSSATVPEIHVVGDAGVYLHSGDNGATWTKTADGLTGTNRAVAARVSGTGYESWVVGDNHHIQYRPPQPQVAPFITFHPGEMDFGMLTLGQSRTLPIEIRNRGKRDLVLTLINVSGNGFSMVQGSVGRIPPGDAMVLQVRFRPAAETAYAQGDLAIADGTQTFHVPLVGRASSLEWQPITLTDSGTVVNGEVLDLGFTSDLVGYALTSSRLLKTLDGGLTWTEISPNEPSVLVAFTFRALDVRRFSGVDFIYLAGHSSSSFSSGGAVWHSGDGGATWAGRTPSGGPHPPFGDIAMLHDDRNAAVCVTSDPEDHDADVWQTTNAGTNWTKKLRPPDEIVTSSTNASFNGGRILLEEIQDGAIPATAGWSVIATDGSAIYSRGFNSEWEYVDVFPVESGKEVLQFDTLQSINAMQFGRSTFLTTGWIVGNQGLYWRWQPIPPNRAPFAGNESEWFPASNQGVFGRTDLQAVSFTTTETDGWIVGGNRIFISKDGGRSWDLDFVTGDESSLKSVFARSATRAWAGGTLAGKATVWRYRTGAIPPQGILAANDVEIFSGTILPGATLTRNISLQNIGNATLNLHHFGIETSDRLNRFRIVGTPPATLAPGASSTIQVAFDASPDPVDVEALGPIFFHRFEQGFTDTRYFDSGPAHLDIDLAGARTVPPANRPKIVADDLRRDRALAFDGDDYAEIPGTTSFPGDFAISLWVNPESTANNQTFISKHSSTGANQLVFGFYSGGYHVNLRGITFTGGTKKTGWQHLLLTGARVTGSNATVITLYRDGEPLWQSTLGQLLGTPTGLPWTLAAERDSATALDSFLRGQLDDVAIFNRLPNEGEIQALASKSPTCGDHAARLVIQSGSENGKRSIELRARVQEVGGAIVIDTVPTGAPVIVDGVSYPTPVSFGVSCTVSGPKEWLEGSQHTIQAPPSVALVANGSTLTYGFANWNLQNSAQRTLSIVARPDTGRVVANYRLEDVTSPGAGLLAPASLEPLSIDSVPNIEAAVAGTPAGPWFRLSNGQLSIPNLGSGFAISGEMFASLTRIKGFVTSAPLIFPNNATRFVELSAAEWQIDMLAGSHFRMRTRPPSLALLGSDVAPDGEFQLNFDLANPRYTATFILREDFRPVPDFFELGQGAASLEMQFPSNQPPIFAMSLDGTLRFLKLPGDVTGQGGWAVNRTASLDFNSANFNISLKNDVVGAANWPATLFNGGPFTLSGGDVRISRVNNGPITLALATVALNVNGQQAATVSGSISTDTSLRLTGSVAGNTQVQLLTGGKFYLESRNGSALNFDMMLRTLPAPRMVLNLPAMRMGCSPGEGADPFELNVPAISFDTSGAFDTGKIPLPTGLVFDGISIDKPSDAALDDNYIRLSRDEAGKVAFNVRAQHRFFIPGVVDCRNDLKVTVDSNDLSASYHGNFCVLPEPISLSFDGNDSCQFSGSAFGQTIFFGAGCVGIRNDATGVCVGTCQ